MFERLKERGFQLRPLHHAEAILRHDMADATRELEEALLDISIPAEELVRGGGGEGQATQRMRRRLADRYGWEKHQFEIVKTVDGERTEALSHEVDHVKQFGGWTFALEIEWNNKDPFFDRDLENFKRLHAEGAISIGGIVTRGESLHQGMGEIVENFAASRAIETMEQLSEFYAPTARQREKIQRAAERSGSFAKGWANAFIADKFGEATTHWRKLDERVNRGVGNPCPLLLIGIPREIVVD